MASAPSVMACSNAAIVFSGATADAPRWAITSGRPGGPLVVSVVITVAKSGCENADPGRLPPRCMVRRARLLRHSLRRSGQHPGLRPRDHPAEPCHVCGSGPGLDPGSPTRVLHGLEGTVWHSRARLVDSPPACVSRRHRIG